MVYERGDLDQAARLLQVYLPLIRDVGLADPVMIGHVLGSRIAFRHGDVATAAQQLEFAVRAARTAQRHRRALKLGVLQAMALHRIGQAQTALPLLQEVLKSCCAEGYMALVLDEGPLPEPEASAPDGAATLLLGVIR